MKLDCGQPEAAAGHRMRLLFGLAPGGVYHALDVTIEAVRSYRTFSPLPAFAKASAGKPAPLKRRWAVCFLWHFP